MTTGLVRWDRTVLILAAVELHARPSLPTAVFALVVALVLFVLAVRPFFYPVPSGLDSSELVSFHMRRNESSLFSLLIAASAFHLCYLARRFLCFGPNPIVAPRSALLLAALGHAPKTLDVEWLL